MVSDYIYIVHCEQHKDTNIYKIGRTSQQEFRRFNGYPKNSELLLYIHVNNSYKIEIELLAMFKQKYKQITSAGAEYFQGDVKEMVRDITKIALDNFDTTITKPIADDLINTFPNYKYDYSFGGRHRLCLIKNNTFYYIESKELKQCDIDIDFVKRIFNFYKHDKNVTIRNNVYFKYTEKIIDQVIQLVPYKFTEIITPSIISYFNYNSFLNNPEYLFSCNCKIGNNYIKLSKINNYYTISNEIFIVRESILISYNLIYDIIPYKVLLIDTHYGVIFDDEYTDDVDCTTLYMRSKSIDNDVLLYYILYSYVLSNKECLINDEYEIKCNKYLQVIAQLINDTICPATIGYLYDPFKDAVNSEDVLKSYSNYIDVMCLMDNINMDNFNYGLYWLLMKDELVCDSLDLLFTEYSRWILTYQSKIKLNYHSACKWWFENTTKWKLVTKNNIQYIDWNNILFEL